MLCSGCGKDIPFNGDVCPYCMRDKSNDKAGMVLGFLFGFVGGAIGYYFFDILGALGGFVVGVFIGALTSAGSATKPPEVQVVAPPSPTPKQESSLAGKLTELQELHQKGLLTDEEYASKKAKLLADF